MSLDLNSSNTYAERLGHVRFSRLIDVIFNKVNRVAEANQGQIYNYLGDEVILTWPEALGLRNAQCLRIVGNLLERISIRKEFFQAEFGMVPEFKAGLHGGEVTVAEVGIVKRDISFFGDVVNTASRLQALCKDQGRNFLTSDDIYRSLKDTPGVSFQYIGKFTLRGKKEPIGVYSVC